MHPSGTQPKSSERSGELYRNQVSECDALGFAVRLVSIRSFAKPKTCVAFCRATQPALTHAMVY